MRTREEAERIAAALNGQLTPSQLVTRHYGVDQSGTTGAWRVIEHREGYFAKVVSS